MVNIKQIDFRYKGERDYIHGTDMFNAMMDVSKSAATYSNIHFTIHDFVRRLSCQLYLTDNKESLNEVDEIAVRCQLNIDAITHWIAIVPNAGDIAMEERYAYDESQIVSLCNMLDDGIVLNQLSPFSFIETIVAMNKHMHQQLFPEVDGKWIFTRIDLPIFCDVRENLALRLRHNMNYRLTKSDVVLNGKKIGDIFFSLVKT